MDETIPGKKFLTDVRISAGAGYGFTNGTKLATLNFQSLLFRRLNGTIGFDYYFIKDKEERQLKNIFAPTLLLSYNFGTDKEGNELLLGAGISFENTERLRPLISLKGNLYLKNSFYLGLEIRQPFLESVPIGSQQLGIFVTPFIGVNLFYRIIN
ncbi:MAG: hypothetical protein ABI462_00165 [Ignavibacteria bacterium]